MLIHEITYPRASQIDEGFMDQAKAAAKATAQYATPKIQQGAKNLATKTAQLATRGGKALGSKLARSAPATAMRSAQQTVGNIGKGTGTSMRQEYKIRQLANKAQISWNKFKTQYAGSLGDEQEKQDYLSGKDGLLHDQLTDFVEKNFLNGKSAKSFANGHKIDAIINKIANSHSAQAPAPGVTQRQKPVGSATSSPVTKQSNQRERTVTPRGTTVISGEPRVLRFQGVDYVRNERGDWANFKTGRPAPEGQQAFLNNEDEYFDTALSESISGLNPKETQLFIDLTRQAMLATTARQKSAQTGNRASVKSTGNPDADAVLQQAGFALK